MALRELEHKLIQVKKHNALGKMYLRNLNIKGFLFLPVVLFET